MREGRALVRATSRFASEHAGRSWWYALSTGALFTALVVVACLDITWLVRVPASCLLALAHVRLFVIYHDHQHGAVLRGSRLASVVFWVYGLLSLAPPGIWDETHDYHHRNNCRKFGLQNPGSFPVMSTKAWRRAGFGTRFFYTLSRHPLTILLGYLTVFLYNFCLLPVLVSPIRRLDAGAALVLHLGLVVTLAFLRPDVLLFAILLPAFLASALGSYLFYAQHNFPAAKLRPDAEWDYVFAALRSSSYIRMHPVLRWFTANIGYHHVHHLNHRIPFYRLPEAMAALEDLQSPGVTSLRPRDIARCLKLKLWDPERQRLVSFREAERPLVAAVGAAGT